MQLCIKQRVFSWSDTYDIYDAAGTPRYFVRAELFTFGHRIHVYEKATGREVGAIYQRLFAFRPCFEIAIGDQVVGTVRRQFALFHPVYQVDFMGWNVDGDLFGWDYQVLQGTQTVMTISKQWLTWGDTYLMEYDDPANEMPGLLLVLAIDAANCSDD